MSAGAFTRSGERLPERSRGGRRPVSSVFKNIGLVIALPIILLAIWWFATAGSTNPFVPPLSEILGEFPRTWLGARILEDVIPSLTRLLGGYLIALVVGVLLGILIGVSRTLRALTEPVFEFVRAIPPPVLIPVLMLFLGIGPVMKVVVIASACLWPILLNTIEGVRGIDLVLLDTAKSYQLRPLTRLRVVVLRGASPQIIAGGRQALSLGIILMVISEMFAATDGIGYTIIGFQRSYAVPEMWTGIIMLGILGVLLSLIFRLIERQSLRWYRGLRQSERGEA